MSQLRKSEVWGLIPCLTSASAKYWSQATKQLAKQVTN